MTRPSANGSKHLSPSSSTNNSSPTSSPNRQSSSFSSNQTSPFATKTDLKKRIEDVLCRLIEEVNTVEIHSHTLIEESEQRTRDLFYQLNCRYEERVKTLLNQVKLLEKSFEESRKREESFAAMLLQHTKYCVSLFSACEGGISPDEPTTANGGLDPAQTAPGPTPESQTQLKTSPTTFEPLNGATFPWPPIPPGEADANADILKIPPFVSFTGVDFDKWGSQMDRLWYGHKDPLYRADFLTAFRTQAKGAVAFWIIGADLEFLRRASWPDVKAMMREYFSPENKVKVELENLRKFLTKAQGGHEFLATVGPNDLRNMMPVMEEQGQGVYAIKRADGQPWGASLATGPLTGFFSRNTRTANGVDTTNKEQSSGNTPTNGKIASNGAPVKQAKGKDRQKEAQAGPQPSSPVVEQHKSPGPTYGRTPPSTKTASAAEPPSVESKPAAAKATPPLKPAFPHFSQVPSREDGSSSASSSASAPLPPLEICKDTATQAPAPPTFEDLADVVGIYNGEPRSFAKWSRKIDELWYANEDPLYRAALLKALPATLEWKPLSWLRICVDGFLEKATWNDWKVVLSTYWGGSYQNTEGRESVFLDQIKASVVQMQHEFGL